MQMNAMVKCKYTCIDRNLFHMCTLPFILDYAMCSLFKVNCCYCLITGSLWLDSILTYNPFTSFPWEFLRNCITLCSKRSGHLHDSGIDLVKVEIDPKLNADAGMEWPHSSISRAFKSPPCDSSSTVCERKLPRWKRTGNI